MILEEILKPHKLNHSKHDELITKISSLNEVSPNIMTIALNAYYKIRNNSHKGGWLESDIDLLQLLYDSKIYDWADNYTEIPFVDSTLLLFEMKTNDTTKNYRKALSQLTKSKKMILKYTDYKDVDCFYAFNIGNSFSYKLEQIN